MNVEDARQRLPDLIDAAVRGEEVVISTTDGPDVRLVPIESGGPQPVFGSAKGMILYMADDFDAPLEEFEEFLDRRGYCSTRIRSSGSSPAIPGSASSPER